MKLCTLKHLPHSFHMVRTQIVHYNDVSRTQRGNQSVFQVIDKLYTGRTARICNSRSASVKPQRRKNGRCFGCVQRRVVLDTRFSNPAPIQAGHVRVYAAFVQENQMVDVTLAFVFFPFRPFRLYIEDAPAHWRVQTFS